MIQTPNPNTAPNSFKPAFLLMGKYAVINMVKKAPTAGAALKTPNPSEPTLRMSWAKIP